MDDVTRPVIPSGVVQSNEAVIVVTPALPTVSTPFSLTVATSGFDEVYVNQTYSWYNQFGCRIGTGMMVAWT